MKTVIDFHSHILPGADHGSDSLKTSQKQLEYAQSSGVKVIVATSHFYPDKTTVASYLSRRNNAYSELSTSHGESLPRIILGAEVLVCHGMERLADIEKLFIRDTKIILLELPLGERAPVHMGTIEALLKMGIKIVLAHIDRYEKSLIDTYLSLGCLAQVNAEGVLKPFAAKRYKSLIREGKLVAIGSDIHGDNPKAHANLLRALSKLGEDADTLLSATADLLSIKV